MTNNIKKRNVINNLTKIKSSILLTLISNKNND